MITLYRHFDVYGTLLYVGITSDMKRRTAEHKARSDWFADVSITTTEEYADRKHTKALEDVAIKFEKPLHNRPVGPKKQPAMPQPFEPVGEQEKFGPPTKVQMMLQGKSDVEMDAIRLIVDVVELLSVLPNERKTEIFLSIPPERFLEVVTPANRRPA